jgi:hypothetical protein
LTHSCKALDLRCKLEVESAQSVGLGHEAKLV